MDKVKEFQGWTHQRYLESKPLPLPFYSHDGRVLETIIVSCKRCSQDAEHVRGTIEEPFNTCIEVDAAGICMHCNSIVIMRLRWYPDGRVLSIENGKWVDNGSMRKSHVLSFVSIVKSFLKKVVDIVRNLF